MHVPFVYLDPIRAYIKNLLCAKELLNSLFNVCISLFTDVYFPVHIHSSEAFAPSFSKEFRYTLYTFE